MLPRSLGIRIAAVILTGALALTTGLVAASALSGSVEDPSLALLDEVDGNADACTDETDGGDVSIAASDSEADTDSDDATDDSDDATDDSDDADDADDDSDATDDSDGRHR